MKQYYLAFLAPLFFISSSLWAQTSLKQVQKSTEPVAAQVDAIEIDGRDHPSYQATQGPRSQAFQPIHLKNRVTQAQVTSGHEILRARDNGLPYFIQSDADPTYKRGIHSSEELLTMARVYLDEVKSPMHIADPLTEFSMTRIEQDDQGHSHLRFQQQYQGLEVYGADIVVHIAPDGRRSLNGRYQATPQNLRLQASISKSAALQLVQQDLQHHTHQHDLDEAHSAIINYQGPTVDLVVYPHNDGKLYLAYHISLKPNTVQRWKYFIDAHTGKVLYHYDHTCSIGPTSGSGTDLNGNNQSFGVFENNNGTYFLIDAVRIKPYNDPTNSVPEAGDGTVLTGDMQNTTNQYSHTTSNNNSWTGKEVSAHVNAAKAFDYFKNTHQRNSIDGSNGDIISFINVADPNGGGDMDNAFWDGQAIYYGNGDVAFDPLAGSLDVAGHEMSHGVVQATANLEYQGQSGALNESFADVFGVMIDRDDWTLGEEVVRPQYFPSGALRSMSNPNQGGNSLSDPGYQPDHMDDLYTGSQDNGGVHINSGIPNHAFYLLAQDIGKNKAEDIFYTVLKDHLTRNSQFIDLRLAAEKVAPQLYGTNELNAVKSAFDQVGILNPGGSGGGTPDPSDLPSNPGQDYVISTDLNNFDPNTLYVSDTNVPPNNYWPVSTTDHKRRASVTDDGSYAFIVDDNSNLRSIFLDLNSPQENQLTTDNFWDNVAISKDGSKLAAISVNIDTAIYVYDFNSQRWGKFTLYNPTFTQGVNTGNVLYADAMEWDYTGENLLYDALSRIDGTLGSDIEYWDIGLINVWDNASQDFGSGEVSKFFTLDPGESIGNASFSKNSPHIIAFDYINENSGDYSVLTSNLNSGEIKTVFTQDVLGYPNYSNDDDKLSFSAKNTSGDPVVAIVGLQGDKLTPQGNAGVFIPDATYGVWFANGTRVISDLDDRYTDLQVDFQAYPNPFEQQFSLSYRLEEVGEVEIALYDLMGKKLEVLQEAQQQLPGEHSLDAYTGHLPAGTYFLRLRLNQEVQTLKMVKM